MKNGSNTIIYFLQQYLFILLLESKIFNLCCLSVLLQHEYSCNIQIVIFVFKPNLACKIIFCIKPPPKAILVWPVILISHICDLFSLSLLIPYQTMITQIVYLFLFISEIKEQKYNPFVYCIS